MSSEEFLSVSLRCRLHELKLAASGWVYLDSGVRWEWNINLFGEKYMLQKVHLIHLALELLYLAGIKLPLLPQAHS